VWDKKHACSWIYELYIIYKSDVSKWLFGFQIGLDKGAQGKKIELTEQVCKFTFLRGVLEYAPIVNYNNDPV